jgi:hypothetical protein
MEEAFFLPNSSMAQAIEKQWIRIIHPATYSRGMSMH